jgi:hypothetical protein
VFLIMLLIALPLTGVILAGKPIDQYLEFPPHTRYVEHPPFSRHTFVILGLVTALSLVPLIVRVVTSRVTAHGNVGRAKAYPWWGVLGASLDSLRLVHILPSLHLHAFVARVHSVRECVDVHPHGRLHDVGTAAHVCVAVSGECGVLVVTRISEPLRAELVLRRRTGADVMGLFHAGNGAVFDRPSGGAEH